ncbi:MAG: sialidase family protein [Candidatus Latescibacterota bacterium]
MPFGDIVPLGEGLLGASLYSFEMGQRPMTAHLYVSADDGGTWTWRSTLREDDTNEVALLPLAGGRLLAAARTCGDAHLELFASSDRGGTWEGCGPLTLGGQHPAHLLQLADGRILLTYGIRNRGLYGLGVRLSADGGETWSDPRVLASWEGARDGGYPASVQAEDGTVVTAYYCNHIPAHQRYHMGVLRWRVEG